MSDKPINSFAIISFEKRNIKDTLRYELCENNKVQSLQVPSDTLAQLFSFKQNIIEETDTDLELQTNQNDENFIYWVSKNSNNEFEICHSNIITINDLINRNKNIFFGPFESLEELTNEIKKYNIKIKL